MSNVWETRYRLVLERLEEIADQLRGEEQISSIVLEEQMVRLLAGVVMLLRQHRVNKRGQCRYCNWATWAWRFGRRRPQCTAYRALAFVLDQRLDIVWWQLLDDHKTRPKFG